MFFTNTAAIKEEATTDAEDVGGVLTSRSDDTQTDEPEEVVIHTQTQDQMPLLSAIKDVEDGQKVDQSERR